VPPQRGGGDRPTRSQRLVRPAARELSIILAAREEPVRCLLVTGLACPGAWPFALALGSILREEDREIQMRNEYSDPRTGESISLGEAHKAVAEVVAGTLIVAVPRFLHPACPVWASAADGVVLLCRPGKTTVRGAEEAGQNLALWGANLLGAIYIERGGIRDG
jgi:hypothetical protein